MNANKEYCCARFAEHASREFNDAGGFERDEEHSYMWHVNGCCGGGCYVLKYMEFCPFCGAELAEIDKI